MRLRIQASVATGAKCQALLFRPEAGRLDSDRVFPDGDLLENEFPGIVAVDRLFERGTHRPDLYDRAAYRAMLRIVNQAADRTENRSAGERGNQQETNGEKRRQV